MSFVLDCVAVPVRVAHRVASLPYVGPPLRTLVGPLRPALPSAVVCTAVSGPLPRLPADYQPGPLPTQVVKGWIQSLVPKLDVPPEARCIDCPVPEPTTFDLFVAAIVLLALVKFIQYTLRNRTA